MKIKKMINYVNYTLKMHVNNIPNFQMMIASTPSTPRIIPNIGPTPSLLLSLLFDVPAKRVTWLIIMHL